MMENTQGKMGDEETEDTIFDDEEGDKHSLAKINFDLVDTGRWLLKVIAGPNNGAEFSMHADVSYVVGTDPSSCDIVFHDTSVSRQHGRITIDKRDEIYIEDLKSRNGTTVDGETVVAKRKLTSNSIIVMGTTTFTIYDRDGEMQTVISPLLPAIVKVLQKEDEPSKAAEERRTDTEASKSEMEMPPPAEEPLLLEKASQKSAHSHRMGSLIVIGMLTGLFAIIGLGTAALFHSAPVVQEEQVDASQLIVDALKPFPAVKPYYTKGSGRLQLIGHVSTLTEKNQLLYSLQGLNFIKEIDDRGLIIDQYSWQDINQALSTQPAWKGISVSSPVAGKFVINGRLQTRQQQQQLSDYLASNFSYFDILENRIFVEEDVVSQAVTILRREKLNDIAVQIVRNELSLNGQVAADQQPALKAAVDSIEKIPGVTAVNNLVKEIAKADRVINISNKYEVTGFSRRGNSFSVVIHGRILTVGDELDGLRITAIRTNTISLEKEGIQYRIDF
jgi:type III secretion system YscD/HrpQ family protein